MKFQDFYAPLNEWAENKAFDALWSKYVPGSGNAETAKGEAIRAVGRLEHDYFNNGYGNARDEEPVENDWDDEDEYGDAPMEDRGFDSYYQAMYNELLRYVAKNGGPVNAVKELDIPSTYLDGFSEDFGKAIAELKDWFVKNDSKLK